MEGVAIIEVTDDLGDRVAGRPDNAFIRLAVNQCDFEAGTLGRLLERFAGGLGGGEEPERVSSMLVLHLAAHLGDGDAHMGVKRVGVEGTGYLVEESFEVSEVYVVRVPTFGGGTTVSEIGAEVL